MRQSRGIQMCNTDFIMKERKEYNYFLTTEGIDHSRK